MSQSYGLGARGEVVKQMQRALGEKLGVNITADGQLGKISQSYLQAYQHSVGLADEKDANGICYGPLTQAKLDPFIQSRYVQLDDMQKAADELGVDLASVRAVTSVEAKEFGFFKNGFPVILFERHKFFKYLTEIRGASFANSIAAMNGDICNAKSGGYLGKEAEIKRLDRAIVINEKAALLSASYGLFQLMGFNYALCGYGNVESFVKDMKASEDYQLAAFVKFVKSQPGLLNALRAKNWARFAELYNGSNYAINQYDVKLADAYRMFVKLTS